VAINSYSEFLRLNYAHRVRDDEDVGLGGVVSGSLGQVADNGGVGVEQVCAILVCVTFQKTSQLCLPSRVMPGLRGTPAGMTTISAPLRASARPEGVASWPVTFCVSVAGCGVRATGKGASYLALGVDVANVGSDTYIPRLRGCV
jgi:hypothetical protein